MLVHCFDCAGLVLSSFFLPPTLCAVDGVYLIANVKLADKQQHSSSLPALFASGMRFLALKKAILFFLFCACLVQVLVPFIGIVDLPVSSNWCYPQLINGVESHRPVKTNL